MTTPQSKPIWDLSDVKQQLAQAYAENSEPLLLKLLKANGFLFQELVERQFSVQPIFHEVTFGAHRCDFTWLNDRSDGPEWVLVEVERPGIQIFTEKGEPTAPLNHAIEQVRSWRRYFNEHPSEKTRIFGAVARFRYIVVAGNEEAWGTEAGKKWRLDNNVNDKVEIRTSATFKRAIEAYEKTPDAFWSFAQNPKTRNPSTLRDYWTEYGYFDDWRRILA